MASSVAQVPASLKPADIQRFAMRAAQLQTVKPVIAYWCEYYIIQQILSKGLHNADQEALEYTTALMDKLEQFKNDNTMDPTVVDDAAGKALVSQFALQTFSRADKTMAANKVTRQTADTFQAAATFLDLLSIWDEGQMDHETHKKIRYAKFHALRIAKALKNGEDPNETNPQPENLPALDPNDPEVRALNGESDAALQPAVTEGSGETQAQSTLPLDLEVPTESQARDEVVAVSPLRHDATAFYTTQSGAVSPLDPPDRKLSDGGTYFPRTGPTIASPVTGPIDAPGAGMSPTAPSAPYLPQTPSAFPPALPPTPKAGLDSFMPPPVVGPITPSTGPATIIPKTPSTRPRIAPQAPNGFTTADVPSQRKTMATYIPDEEAVLAAQKHARWAISALNFEDVPTAIKELRAALQDLEGQ